MTAKQLDPQPQFKPVLLTLETQHEVDAVSAIFDYSRITSAVGLKTPWMALEKFKSPAYLALYEKLSSTLTLRRWFVEPTLSK